MMGVFDEVKGDVWRLVLTLGGILLFIGLFKLWAGMGTIGLVLVVIMIAAGLGGYWMWKNNYF